MSQDTQATPGNSPARQLAAHFGAIADTLDWTLEPWQALSARLQAAGVPVGQLTLQQVHDAIDAVRTAHQAGA